MVCFKKDCDGKKNKKQRRQLSARCRRDVLVKNDFVISVTSAFMIYKFHLSSFRVCLQQICLQILSQYKQLENEGKGLRSEVTAAGMKAERAQILKLTLGRMRLYL